MFELFKIVIFELENYDFFNLLTNSEDFILYRHPNRETINEEIDCLILESWNWPKWNFNNNVINIFKNDF